MSQEDENCAFCLENIGDKKYQPCCKQCNKFFHFDCHLQYFAHRVRHSNYLPCPMCRADIPYKDDSKYDIKIIYNSSENEKDIRIKID